MKPTYQIVIRITEGEKSKLDKLRKEAFKVVDVFRTGLWYLHDEKNVCKSRKL